MNHEISARPDHHHPKSRSIGAERAGMRVASPNGYNEPMSGSDRVKPAIRGVKLTYDDFVLFPEDGKRHEIIDGEHYVTPSPNTKHQSVSGNLYLLIGALA